MCCTFQYHSQSNCNQHTMKGVYLVLLVLLCIIVSGQLPCPDGSFYDPTVSQIPCSPCPRGYVSHPNRQRCVQCTPGFFSSITQCLPCPPGTFAPVAGSYQCISCPPGMVAPFEGMSACISCETGMQAKGTTTCESCPPGFTSSPTVNGTCVRCSPGSFSAKTATGNQVCSLCQAGRYSNYPTDSCSVCEGGKYAPTPGMTACLNCQKSFVTPSNSSDRCIQCPPLETTEYPGSNKCLPVSLSVQSEPSVATQGFGVAILALFCLMLYGMGYYKQRPPMSSLH